LEVKERRREKERQKAAPKRVAESSVDNEAPKTDVLADVAQGEATETALTEDLESTLTEPAAEALTTQTTIVSAPPWGSLDESGWMYSIPLKEEDKESWEKEWAEFLVTWTESRGIHVLSVSTFIKEKPFSDILGKVEAFRLIGDWLIENDIGEWLDDKKRQLRVYWRPLEEWADLIRQWAIKTGKIRLDIQSIIVQERTEDFSKLPERDLRLIMEIMVERKIARWVDPKRGAIIIVV
jgi:ESCRT-II complex subunit